jgi:C4-dicarboxylate-binding protein DctP
MSFDIVPRALAALAASLLSATVAMAESVPLRVSYETPVQHIKSRTIVAFKDALEELSKGYFKVELYPAAQLMGPSEEVAATARGQIEMSAPYFSYLSSVEPLMNVYQLPLVFTSYEQLWRFLETEEATKLAALLERRGLQPAGYWFENPSRLWSKAPIRSVSELAGKKIRVVPSETLQKAVSAMGALPTAIPGTELYLALQQGVADGAFTAPNYGLAMKYNEVTSSVTKLDLFYGGYFVMFSKRWFDRLPADRQAQLGEAVAQARALNEANVRKDLAAIDDQLRAGGVDVIELSNERIEEFRAALQPFYAGLDPKLAALAKTAAGL